MGDTMIKIEQFDMLRAMYDFQATFAKTLSFKENEHFILHQTGTKERNWWQVVNRMGQLGFVPSNYVQTVKVSPEFFRQFLDDCVNMLNSSDSDSSLSSTQTNFGRQELISRLIEKKRQADLSSQDSEGNKKPQLDLLFEPVRTGDGISRSPSGSSSQKSLCSVRVTTPPNKGQGEGTVEVLPPLGRQNSMEGSKVRPSQSETKHCESTTHVLEKDTHKSLSSPVVQSPIVAISPSGPTPAIPLAELLNRSSKVQPVDVYRIVNSVRKSTDVSHKMACIAVTTVVCELQELLPPSLAPHLGDILSHLQGSLDVPEVLLLSTYDAKRLQIIFSEMCACKDDSEQRSWMLHEDEEVIIEYVMELISILSNADPKISCLVMSKDNWEGVIALVQYYQMEVRWTIRQLLLQAFGVICSLDCIALKIMLDSVLPIEVARDMCSNPRNIPKLHYSSILLTMLFSMGEEMPIAHYEFLGKDFMLFLFKFMESPPDTDVEDKIPDLFLNLILAYNLQFEINSENNMVLQAVVEQSVANTFTEKILLLLNREEDPVRVFEHDPAPSHSVLKLFTDLFGLPQSANIFYTNDTKVLIDIVVRQLSDLSPGEPKRQQYLELIRRVLRNSNYSEHFHRRDDLLKIFTRIFCEEAEDSQKDQQLVREISNEFPHYFKS